MQTVSSSSMAAALPGAADAARVRPEIEIPEQSPAQNARLIKSEKAPVTEAPEGADKIRFVLKEVHIEGMSAFTEAEMRDLYADKLSTEITLSAAWQLADAVTQRYRDAGYFLSRAYVPAQSVEQGAVTIKVAEGYIGEVALEDKKPDNWVVRSLMERIKAEKPISANALESLLLRLNDVPGYSFRAVLSPLENGPEGAVRLNLVPAKTAGQGLVTVDNTSSRFLGPHEVSAAYAQSLLPLSRTSVSGLTGLPPSKLVYANLEHSMMVLPDITVSANGSITRSKPGYTLEPFDIESRSNALGVSVAWQWVRQRQENLSLRFGLDGRNTESDLLNTPFTRDRIRALRAGFTYDRFDPLGGYNIVSSTLSRGISGLGASDAGDINLSRAQARPDFTKLELSASHLQPLPSDFSMLFAMAGQLSSGPLFSAEEFGYGGQAFGRAFDASELTGDEGVNTSIELRYAGIPEWQSLRFSPYAFYDIGVIWNDDISQEKRASGASAGLGMRFTTEFNLNGNFGLAFPLTRDIATPFYGQNPSQPRLFFQLSQGF